MAYKVRSPVLRVYQGFFEALETRGGLSCVLVFGRLFGSITPAFAESYRIQRTGGLWNRLSLLIFLAALLHCLVTPVLLTFFNNTLLPVPGMSIEFLEDKWNIVLYTLICPAYVTLSIRLTLLAMEKYEEGDAYSERYRPATQVRRVYLNILLILFFSSLLITNYVSDALDPSVIPSAYWFTEELSGVRRLNGAGIYYIVLNFCLLFLTFLGGSAFISISMDGIRLSRSLLNTQESIDFEIYRLRLDRLVVAYFWAFLLAACYALNIVIWKHSPLGGTENIQIAGVLFTIVGIFFVSAPRRFIEHAWASYCARKNADQNTEHQEIVDPDVSNRVAAIEILCIGSWLTHFYELNPDPLRFLAKLFG